MFHSYVSLPEGKVFNQSQSNQEMPGNVIHLPGNWSLVMHYEKLGDLGMVTQIEVLVLSKLCKKKEKLPFSIKLIINLLSS